MLCKQISGLGGCLQWCSQFKMSVKKKPEKPEAVILVTISIIKYSAACGTPPDQPQVLAPGLVGVRPQAICASFSERGELSSGVMHMVHTLCQPPLQQAVLTALGSACTPQAARAPEQGWHMVHRLYLVHRHTTWHRGPALHTDSSAAPSGLVPEPVHRVVLMQVLHTAYAPE